MFELSDQLKTDQPTHAKNGHILKAKMQLYEICFSKAKQYLFMVNESAGDIFEKIQDGQTSIFVDYYNLVQQCSAPEGESTDLKRELDQN